MKLNRILAVIAAAAALAACNNQPTPGSTASVNGAAAASTAEPGAVTPSAALIEAKTKGFSVGSLMSAHTSYIFFDAQCSHCGHLWEAAKPLQGQTRFVWIPVGLLNKASIAQGATILAAKDPAASMNEHEKLLSARQGGITADASLTTLQGVVTANTEVLKSFGIKSIPYTYGMNALTGKVVVLEGSMSTAELAAKLGLSVSVIGPVTASADAATRNPAVSSAAAPAPAPAAQSE